MTAAKSPRQKSIKFDSLGNFNPLGEADAATEIYRQRLKEEQYRCTPTPKNIGESSVFRSAVLEEMVDTLRRQTESTSHTNEVLTNDLRTLRETLLRAEQSKLRSAEASKQREQVSLQVVVATAGATATRPPEANTDMLHLVPFNCATTNSFLGTQT